MNYIIDIFVEKVPGVIKSVLTVNTPSEFTSPILGGKHHLLWLVNLALRNKVLLRETLFLREGYVRGVGWARIDVQGKTSPASKLVLTEWPLSWLVRLCHAWQHFFWHFFILSSWWLNLPQFSGWKWSKYLKPPPSLCLFTQSALFQKQKYIQKASKSQYEVSIFWRKV